MSNRSLFLAASAATGLLLALGCSSTEDPAPTGGEPSGGFELYSTPEVAGSESWPVHARAAEAPSVAYAWLEGILETSARRVDRIGARPTTIAREMMIPLTAMYDAWACYDAKAVGTRLGGKLRRPAGERTQRNKEIAVGYAALRCLEDLFPEDLKWVHELAQKQGIDPANTSTDVATAAGIGNEVAAVLLAYRHRDGANQLGEAGDGTPYSDTSGYKATRGVDEPQDPDRWKNIPFAYPDGRPGHFYPDPLTPHWGKVKTIGYTDPEPFRTAGPPKAKDPQLRREVDECIQANASLSLRQKAIVELMRDGPRSTGQSGHWLRFAMDLSRREKQGIDEDVKLFFAIGCMAHDAFVMCWEEKYRHDSSRPYWYVRHFYAGQEVLGYAGPCEGFKRVKAEDWHPYSPASFVTPPFPGYPSGHATVSGACAKLLELFSGSDRFEFVAERVAGELTEADCTTFEMQALEGVKATDVAESKRVRLPLPTFSSISEMAAESRLLGGYHIRSDNDDGLKLGRKMAVACWPRYRAYWEGTAKVLD
ncbi:MAG TPA: haloperoxidase [Planctomycetes bacterium]|nr:haloperoxidase [Planctomycetota bacterium]